MGTISHVLWWFEIGLLCITLSMCTPKNSDTADSASDTDSDSDADTDSDTDSDSDTDTDSDTGTDSDSDTDTDSDSDTDTDSDSDTDTDSDSDTDTDTDSDTDTDADTDTNSDTESDTGSDTASDTGIDTGTDTSGTTVTNRLITSGPDGYWDTAAALTVATDGAANLQVDENRKFQQWDGFGGTFNEMGWDALQAVSDEISTALTLLFHPTEGANFVMGRIPIGASDYAMSWYTLDDTVNDYEMQSFSIERDKEMLIPYIQASLEINPELHLWGSPWVVPDWMMDGRAMRSDPQTLKAHALYLAKFVEEYNREGMTIEAVHVQNEPGYARVRWDQSVLISYFKTYLGPTFAERDLDTQIWCGTMSHPDDAAIAEAVANDPESMAYVTGFGLQWNLADTVSSLAPHGPVMQTEHKCGNYNFETPYWDQSRYDANMPQNDHLYAEESWQLIRDWIAAGVNSYSAWNMVLDTRGVSLDNWPQNALLVVDRQAKKLIVTPAYYVFRHFSRYLSPDAMRIAISGADDALAFQNPDDSIVVQYYNKANTLQANIIDVRGELYQFSTPAHGWATIVIGSSGK
jgi:glucosylceramidase